MKKFNFNICDTTYVIECFKCGDFIEDGDKVYGMMCGDCAREEAIKTFSIGIGEAFVRWYNENIGEEGIRTQTSQYPIHNRNVNFYDEILDDMSVESIREMIEYVIDTAIKGKKSRFNGFEYFYDKDSYEDYLRETCLDRLPDEYLKWLFDDFEYCILEVPENTNAEAV